MIEILQSSLLKNFTEITHFFSTRRKAYSNPPFHWANMSLKVGDQWALRNRMQLSEILRVPLNKFVFLQQTHGNNIHIATEADAGKGAFSYQTAINDTDALITEQSMLMLIITTADCVPILAFDKDNRIIAAIHAGWRGTAKRITYKTIEMMIKKYNSKPENIYLAIGPSIGQCCYEVGEEVFEEFEKTHGPQTQEFFSYRDKKLFLDLWKTNKFQLLDLNIPERNIDILSLCTSCNNDKFYSARRGDKGRQLSGIMIKKD